MRKLASGCGVAFLLYWAIPAVLYAQVIPPPAPVIGFKVRLSPPSTPNQPQPDLRNYDFTVSNPANGVAIKDFKVSWTGNNENPPGQAVPVGWARDPANSPTKTTAGWVVDTGAPIAPGRALDDFQLAFGAPGLGGSEGFPTRTTLKGSVSFAGANPPADLTNITIKQADGELKAKPQGGSGSGGAQVTYEFIFGNAIPCPATAEVFSCTDTNLPNVTTLDVGFDPSITILDYITDQNWTASLLESGDFRLTNSVGVGPGEMMPDFSISFSSDPGFFFWTTDAGSSGVSVPEPGIFALLFVGFFAMGAGRWRKLGACRA